MNQAVFELIKEHGPEVLLDESLTFFLLIKKCATEIKSASLVAQLAQGHFFDRFYRAYETKSREEQQRKLKLIEKELREELDFNPEQVLIVMNSFCCALNLSAFDQHVQKTLCIQGASILDLSINPSANSANILTIAQPAHAQGGVMNRIDGVPKFAKVSLRLEHSSNLGCITFFNDTTAHEIPLEYVKTIDATIRKIAETGFTDGSFLSGIEVHLCDGAYDSHDSDDASFEAATIKAFESALIKAGVKETSWSKRVAYLSNALYPLPEKTRFKGHGSGHAGRYNFAKKEYYEVRLFISIENTDDNKSICFELDNTLKPVSDSAFSVIKNELSSCYNMLLSAAEFDMGLKATVSAIVAYNDEQLLREATRKAFVEACESLEEQPSIDPTLLSDSELEALFGIK